MYALYDPVLRKLSFKRKIYQTHWGLVTPYGDVDLCQHYPRPWWPHQMETFSALLALCAGNSLVTGEFPSQGHWSGALIFSLICAWINGWVNSQAGNLTHHRAHYDVTVIAMACCLTAPSHYLNRYCLVIKTVLWHSLWSLLDQFHEVMNLIRNTFKTIFPSPMGPMSYKEEKKFKLLNLEPLFAEH